MVINQELVIWKAVEEKKNLIEYLATQMTEQLMKYDCENIKCDEVRFS